MHINKITIKDANISLNIEQFAEEFKRLKMISLVNLQLDYNQSSLNKILKDFIEFLTPLNLL